MSIQFQPNEAPLLSHKKIDAVKKGPVRSSIAKRQQKKNNSIIFAQLFKKKWQKSFTMHAVQKLGTKGTIKKSDSKFFFIEFIAL